MKRSIKSNNLNNIVLDILICPVSKKPLVLDKKNNKLISKKARLAYPIIDGIPMILKEKARKLK